MAYITDKNGNYKRTVSCGYCYETGHNQGSCEQKKQHVLDSIASYEQQLADNNFSDDWERRHAERYLERYKQQLEKSNNKGKNRKCSYCTEPGHTRRTCKKRKGDMSDWATQALAARHKFSEKFIEYGLGPGALVSMRRWREEDPHLALVESIFWENLSHETALGANNEYVDIVATRSILPDEYHPRGEYSKNRLNADVADINNVSADELERARNRRHMSIESPVEVSFPDDFLTIPGCITAAVASENFSKERLYMYHGVEYDE